MLKLSPDSPAYDGGGWEGEGNAKNS
jgi:hypothetical protein